MHGKNAVESAKRISEVLFKGDVRDLSETDFLQLEMDGLEVFKIEPGAGLLTSMSDAGISKSRSDARNLVKSGGVSVNSISINDETHQLETAGALYGKYHLVRRGKKNHKLLVTQKNEKQRN